MSPKFGRAYGSPFPRGKDVPTVRCMTPAPCSAQPPKLSQHLARKVAVAAVCDPRTVAKFMRGDHVQDLARARIAEALAAHPELAALVSAVRTHTPESA